MSSSKKLVFSFCVFLFGLLTASSLLAQPTDPALFSGLHWRLVGPFRGGRSLSAVGVPGHPNLFYFGAVGGGVWKSTDAGATWDPIFDNEPIASIGAVAVAPSDSNIIYVGSGEADMRSDISYGNGMYKSVDGGRSWTHIGLEGTRQIGRILVDPANPNLVFVAALGHAYAANPERGVYRSTDGGQNWSLTLHPNDDTGAIDLAMDPQDSRVLYACMWQTRRPPWNVYPASKGPGSGLYKSTDGGLTWQRITGNGLPTEEVGRMGIAIAPTDHNRIYLIADAKQGGLYRSDDGGKSWRLMDNEARIWARGWYFGGVTVDPHNEDIVYVPNVAVYKSVDGGKTFTAFKGAPGGDDYHSLWIAPENSNWMVLSSDQGTVVSLNGGKSWSSWYNQPTGQFYHVATDNRFPYWIYGAQQDSGALALPSRSNYASINPTDWMPITVGDENGYLAPDPLNPEIVFGGTVSRYNWITAQNQEISPATGRPGPFRHTWTLPLVFSDADPHKLYFSFQMLFRTVNGGNSWDQISPDLTRENPGVPANLDAITAGYGLASPRKGVIYSIAPSPLDPKLIWVGTDDGLIHRTDDDGQHWTNVTPPQISAWSKVGIIEASHFDRQTAYAAVDRHRLDDLRPYIYRTHDGGKSWRLVATGIPEGAYVNVVREDRKRKGLLFAGTELGMYVSFNDGGSWQPLQLNLPVASIRDIAIHDDDLVVATHGRAFWVLDDMSPLREVEARIAAQPAYLFRPQTAFRTRPGSYQGTPLPQETPHAANPPNGAIIDYYLNTTPSAPITLEILDSNGRVARRYASSEKPRVVEEKAIRFTLNWVQPEQRISATPGMHRFVWDMRYGAQIPETPDGFGQGGGGPWSPPGKYTVRLTVNGQIYERPLTLNIDPRVKVSQADLVAQFNAAEQCGSALAETSGALKQASEISDQLERLQLKNRGDNAIMLTLNNFAAQLSRILGPILPRYGPPVIPLDTDQTSLRHLFDTFMDLERAIESADAAPTLEQRTALQKNQATLQTTLSEWNALLTRDLPSLNGKLKQAGVTEIKPATAEP